MGKGPPGARSKDNDRTTDGSWDRFAHQGRGKERGKGRSANIANEEGRAEENEIDPEQERNEAAPVSFAVDIGMLIIPATGGNLWLSGFCGGWKLRGR